MGDATTISLTLSSHSYCHISWHCNPLTCQSKNTPSYDTFSVESIPREDSLSCISLGGATHCSYIYSLEDKITVAIPQLPLSNVIMISGSFNPFHIGHEELAIKVESLTAF